MGAINGTHISIAKPIGFFLRDYYYHKIACYNIVAKVMVDSQKGSWTSLWGCLRM
jgi:hypothetical protein